MGNVSYQLILEGVADGFNLQEVKEKLAAIFKTKPEKMDAVFRGKPVVIKKSLDSERALLYKSIFEGAGAACRIEALEEEDDIPSHMIQVAEEVEEEDGIPAHMIEGAEETEEEDIPSHMIEEAGEAKEEDGIPAHMIEQSADATEAVEETSMVCPRCGHEQVEAQTCVACGVHVDKFLKLMAKKEKEEDEEPEDPEALEDQEEEEQDASRVVLGIDRRFYEQVADKEEPVTSRKDFLKSLLSDNRRLVTIGVVALVVLLVVLEFFVLRGDLVAKDSIRIDRRSDYVAIRVNHLYENYSVNVSTGKKKQKLSILLEDPIGRIIYEETEYASQKGSRRFTFEPEERGTYALYVNDGSMGFSERGYAKVSVYMNDHSILGRILGWFNI